MICNLGRLEVSSGSRKESHLKKLIARKNGFPFFRPVHPRRTLTVRMDTTNYCNLRCSMCPMSLADSDTKRVWQHMKSDTFGKILREVFPFAETVGISCGAEPLMNPGFIEYLRLLFQSGVPYRQMVTNGTLLDSETIDAILKYPPTSLFISIDGADRDTHAAIRGGADLDKIIAMTQLLVTKRGRRLFPMVGFSTTLQRDNLSQLSEIVSLAHRVGAVSVGVVSLVPYDGLNTLDRVVNTHSAKAKKEIDRAEAVAGKLGISFHLTGAGEGRTSPHPCPYLLDTVFIDPGGYIYPCPYWNTEHPLGNIADGFKRTWKGSTYRRLRSGQFVKTDNCLNCPEVTSGAVEIKKARQ